MRISVERPVLFNTAMVRAVLDGSKTQTRRVIKPQPKGASYGHEQDYSRFIWEGQGYPLVLPCPYGRPGDRLWAREAFAIEARDPGEYSTLVWRADREAAHTDQTQLMRPHYFLESSWEPDDRWRPSIHMPRWASRITLEVTDVRVERVQDISDLDVLAEGVRDNGSYDRSGLTKGAGDRVFRPLWDSINAKRGFGWNTNPWVWVVEFARNERSLNDQARQDQAP